MINSKAQRITWKFDGKDPIEFKSKAELYRARILDVLKMGGIIKDWQYEPRTFLFHGDDLPKGLKGKQYGVRKYTPDFCVTELDGSEYYEEVKNDDIKVKDKTKMKCMSQYHPDVKMWFVLKRNVYGKRALLVESIRPYVERVYVMNDDCRKLGLK